MKEKELGALLRRLRQEQGITQRALAERLHVSAQAVSKWETGAGVPDVQILPKLAGCFGVSVERLLAGDLEPNESDGGNMKRTKFYVCPDCGNVLTATGGAEVHCCGRALESLRPQRVDGPHAAQVQEVEEDWYVTFSHPMEKGHFIRFAAYVAPDRVLLVRLYPEQGGEVRIPRMWGGRLYLCCNQHGLFEIPT